MYKVFVSFLFTIVTTMSLQAQEAKHVVLITIDGFRPNFYMEDTWQTPNLMKLKAEGTHALGVNSVFPSMTYPSHTTIVTGVKPAKHGVYFNGMFEPNGSTGKIYWNDSSIKAKTLWTAAKEKGLVTAAMFWPVAAEAPVTYNIADIGSLGEKAREDYSVPTGFLKKVKKELFNDSARVEYGKDQNVAAIAAYVIKTAKPALMTVHLFGVDHYSHEAGRDGEAPRAAVRAADSAIGIIRKSLEDAGIWNNTVFIVTGDHGFTDVETSVNPNVWLVKAGFITDVKTDEWKAQFTSVSGSSYLYLRDKNDKATSDAVLQLLNKLPADQKKYFRIITRKQMDAEGANPEAAFALTAENGATLGSSMKGEAIKPRKKGGVHGNFPDFKEIQTGMITTGPNIRKGGVVREMGVVDYAPLIAKILGLNMPVGDGKIPAGVFIK
ncbi:MAG: alkaline phosphatase family protein [Chitinophagaceae bacterium]|nr:MAG: alkaline phosphatase family protein [Chitinophagaceae bacterium]